MLDATPANAVVVGGGPAGLMAAETLATAGVRVRVLDHMPSVGRKLLMAGRGGLNLTHSEPFDDFVTRYGAARERLEPLLREFPPAALVAWAEGLGQPTFVGSSGRVFPRAMKASPLLRAWLGRLRELGVTFRRERWRPGVAADATVLACGGASWPRLGSDGLWAADLFDVAPFQPSNMGFAVSWSEPFRQKFAGTPLKRVALTHAGVTVRGEAMVTADGIEGGAVYALSAAIRERGGPVTLDLRPDATRGALAAKLNRPRAGQSLSTFLRKAANLPPVAIGLAQEALHRGSSADDLAALVKAVPLRLGAPQGLARAISTAGGLRWSAVDEHLMVRAMPGTFAAGEMLDWEAPTGGYLMQACFATGVAAGRGALRWIGRERD